MSVLLEHMGIMKDVHYAQKGDIDRRLVYSQLTVLLIAQQGDMVSAEVVVVW